MEKKPLLYLFTFTGSYWQYPSPYINLSSQTNQSPENIEANAFHCEEVAFCNVRQFS